MPHESYDRKQLQVLKAAAKDLHEISLRVGRAIDRAAETGELQPAKDAFAELELKTAEYEKFRATLSREVLFLARYNVEVHDDHTVSFVLPRGVSRIEVLEEGQQLDMDFSKYRNLIWPEQLTLWQQDPTFKRAAERSERIIICGHVRDSLGKSRAEQEALVGKQCIPTREDLAVAFAVHLIATGKPLFGWFNESALWSYSVRASVGSLVFFDSGLCVFDIKDTEAGVGAAVAARLTSHR